MKKVLLFVGVVSVVSLASCKKTTTCKYSDGSTTECNKCSASATTSFKTACSLAGGSY